MNIFNNRNVYIFLTLCISILIAFSFYYFDYVNAKKQEMQNYTYEQQASSMYSRVAQMIYEKQKATIAIGIVLAQDNHLIHDIKTRKIHGSFYKKLTRDLRSDTEYKNIWIQIVDTNLNSIYRSWTNVQGDSLKKVREDLLYVKETKKVTYTISSGKFDLTIKALIPILDGKKLIGILELISHFNSISNTLQKFKIDSVVALNKSYSQKLQYPFSGKFMDGYYVANLDAPQDKINYLQEHGIENYFSVDYKVENSYMIAAFPLIAYDGDTLGYYIMFTHIDDISSVDEDFFVFKWVAIGFIIILIVAGLVNMILFYILARQKTYIKNIIDSSTNIVIINDKKKILDVNQTFFSYFTKQHSIEEFAKKYNCICDLFVAEEGYVQKSMNGEIWVDYVINNPQKAHKVKINYEKYTYYFNLGIALISPEKGYYSVILSDVTNEESYKHKLEKLTITDDLTNVGNRRYYKIKIEENLALAKRYKFPLSLIMIDIDFFKKVNDEHGHGVGDNVLIEYSKLIAGMIREADIFCRMGGEEFVIIVPYADVKTAQKLAEKIRKKVEEHKVVLPITMSFGVTEYILGEDEDYLLKRADDALYVAKENGRNQVVVK